MCPAWSWAQVRAFRPQASEVEMPGTVKEVYCATSRPENGACSGSQDASTGALHVQQHRAHSVRNIKNNRSNR